jgi:TolA-binding protein
MLSNFIHSMMGGGHPWPPPPDAAARDDRRATTRAATRKMFSKVLVILVCATGAATLVSCMNAPMSPGIREAIGSSQTAHLAPSTDHAMENAIEMVMDGKYADASKILEPLVVTSESAGDLRQAAEATFWLGYCKEKSGRSAEAAAFYRRAIERYPQTAAARNAQDRLDALGPQP